MYCLMFFVLLTNIIGLKWEYNPEFISRKIHFEINDGKLFYSSKICINVMKEILKKIIIGNKVINYIYVFFLRFVNYKSKKEMTKRSQYSLFDYKNVVKSLELYPEDIVIDNNYYGISFWLKKYSAFPPKLNQL